MKQCLDNKSDSELINKLIEKNKSIKEIVLNNIKTLKSNLVSVNFTLDKIKTLKEIDIIGF